MQEARLEVGILADVFVASQADADQYEKLLLSGESLPADRYDRIEYKGFTGLEFGMLWAIICEEPWDVHRHVLRHISHGPEGESWFEEFPDGLVGVLASMADDAAEKYALLWAATDEMKYRPEAAPVIDDLRRLARLALGQAKRMYLWGSL
jgi:hypothetical protein